MTRPLGIAYVDGPRLRRSLVAACEHAQTQRGELNRINVFPVPDGDTGTNLALTARAIADHLRGNRDDGVDAVAREAAQAAVLGARGNCGMMLSHFLLGFSESLAGRARIAAAEFSAALRAGVDNLYRALDRPVEGTILTVMRETAEAAERNPVPDFVSLVEQLLAHARDALARTPELLPVLRRAGVVDAGAKGFVSLLEGVLRLIEGDPVVAVEEPRPVPRSAPMAAALAFDPSSERFRFCTEALVRGRGLPGEGAVKERLAPRGDSLLVIRSGDVLKVHIHTDEPEEVFRYLRSLGTLATHKVEDMRVQHETVERASRAHAGLARRPVAVMTDSACDLPEEVVRAHGIHVTPLLLVTPGGEVLMDGVDISAEAFHARLTDDADELPTTSQPAPADFLATFARAAEEGEEVLGVILGSGLSGTYASAEAAAGRFGDAPVHLVDSRGASLLQGLLVLKAAEMVELGAQPADVAAELRRLRDASGILFTVDRFDRLLASGRVGKGRAWLGSMLQVKPILELDRAGRVVPVAKAVGRERARHALLRALAERIPPDAERVRFGVAHVSAPDTVPVIGEELRRRYGPDVEVLSAPATPVIATHLGPGAWAVAYLVED